MNWFDRTTACEPIKAREPIQKDRATTYIFYRIYVKLIHGIIIKRTRTRKIQSFYRFWSH